MIAADLTQINSPHTGIHLHMLGPVVLQDLRVVLTDVMKNNLVVGALHPPHAEGCASRGKLCEVIRKGQNAEQDFCVV